MLAASWILILFAGLVAAPVIVFLLEIFAATFLPQRKASFSLASERRPRVVVIVPAHNESTGILLTLSDIKSQLVSGDRLLVIADNCDDDTAIVATAARAEVIERKESDKLGKGYAVDFGLKHISLNPPQVVIIIDADCRVIEGTIDRLAKACQSTKRPIQALDLMTAPGGSPINYSVAEFAWRVKNWVRPLGLNALRLPCHLMGTGMAFPWELIRSAALASGSIVEDLKLSLELAQKRSPALFCPSASITSHFPQSMEGARSQRKRWEEGHIRLICTTVPRLILQSVSSGNLGLFVLSLDLLVPPLSLLMMLVIGTFFVSGLATLFGLSPAAFYISVGCVIGLSSAVILSWLHYGRDILPLRSTFLVAIYILAKLPLYRHIFSRRRVPAWIRTDRPSPAVTTASDAAPSTSTASAAVASSATATTDAASAAAHQTHKTE